MSILTRLTDAERTSVRNAITDDAVPRASFYVLVLLSTAIASFGLLANSTAVVIGAMLIAPLMGPIYGIALGLIRDDRRLLALSGLSEAIGIAIAVGLAVIIGILPFRPEFGSEILLRTKPNLYDLIVAIVAGVAGGYARTSARVSPTLPGVAIATALVPPLAACGLCLADARWDAAFGAFLLFVTNLLAIEVAASAIFVLAGLGGRPAEGRHTVKGVLARFAVPIVLLIPITVFLLQTLVTLVRDDRLARNLRRVIHEDLRAVMGADVTEVRHERRGAGLEVIALVVTPQSIESALVASAEADLRRRVDPAIHLIVRSVISRDADRTGQVFLNDKMRQELRGEREQRLFLTTVSDGLRQGLTEIRGAELIDVQRERADSQRIKATVRAPTLIGPSEVGRMQESATAAAHSPIRLVVRSVLTREADARTYIDEDAATVLQRRVRDALSKALANRPGDTTVLAVDVHEGVDILVTATIATSRRLGRQATNEINRDLSAAIERPTHLTFRMIFTTIVEARP